MELTDLLAKPLLWVLRGLWWLAWDFLVLTVAWSIGWPVCRGVSFGRFPHAGFHGFDDAGLLESIVVCVVGFAVLAGALWLLSSFVR